MLNEIQAKVSRKERSPNNSPGKKRKLSEFHDTDSEDEDYHNSEDGSQSNRSEGEYCAMNPILYQAGLESTEFYLILGGHVEIQSGDEKFLVNYSKFNYMGEKALINSKYIPDYSATVKEHARLLMIKRKDFQRKA